MAAIGPKLQPGRQLDPALVDAASRRGSPEFGAVKTITKGVEVELPPGHGFVDKDGHARREIRVRWWDRAADTYRKSALIEGVAPAALPDTPIPAPALLGYDGDVPVFFGHYWWGGVPAPLAPNVACVDYSAGKGGPLVAYRWEGADELTASRFVLAE